MKILLFLVLSAIFPIFLSGMDKPIPRVVRAESGLTELIKDEILAVQRQSGAVFALRQMKSDHEILVISPNREKTALEVRPYLRKGTLFLVHPLHHINGITLDDAKKILAGKFSEWKKNGKKIRNIYYLKGILTPADPVKGMPRMIAIPYADLAEKMLRADPNSVAVLPLDSLLSPQNAKILSVNGIKPDFDSVTQGLYPMQKLYYIQRIADTPEAHALMIRLRTRKFRKNILESGAIPVPDTEKSK